MIFPSLPYFLPPKNLRPFKKRLGRCDSTFFRLICFGKRDRRDAYLRKEISASCGGKKQEDKSLHKHYFPRLTLISAKEWDRWS
ncbi:hypothetical protein TNIN_461681 [Trichonephila inaurata madagascariensis]|uniref:Uncharacterized protein n=1 Tax=Trichonephila inaurata madagascariensis TaxID=2747483 RepID=A0A8X6YQC7_9ARAC|nr:hypothetical protein TNIN_461681 [Trichonephila inaurata madagascariensis]